MEYKTIKGIHSQEIEIKKSRFITSIKECKSEEEALDFLEEIRKNNRTATHNCYCYIISDNMLTQRYSDDGEPQGTAGIPMLEVLKKEEITNICAVVTRYFGGIKLGASGLIRAYTQAVSEILKKIDVVNMQYHDIVEVKFEYAYLGKIDNYIQKSNVFMYRRNYLEKIENIFFIKSDKIDDFLKNINEITNGNNEFIFVKKQLLPVVDDEICEEYLWQDIINGVK
ncbi:MAG: YigZ family protein [Tissierellia bacterium]|nr:YigZ family protein [Tissierellia bacterium]